MLNMIVLVVKVDRKLAANLYVSKKSKVMLLWNINISLGLVNGSTGHIIGFI